MPRIQLSLLFIVYFYCNAFAQIGSVSGIVKSDEKAVGFATIGIKGTSIGTIANEKGFYILTGLRAGNYQLLISNIGFVDVSKKFTIQESQQLKLNIELYSKPKILNEVTVSGTMKEVSKQNAPVAVEIYTPKFFFKNPTSNMFESLQMVNGVLPTINCNVCNTGDIRINGMEGPYTMVMIDGMPIVSALSTVYGLSGIPNSMIERIEIVKGPSSTLYGSEAVAGLINVITKNSNTAPKVSLDVFGTTYKEYNIDAATSYKWKKASTMLSVNYFNFNQQVDKNNDNFTDLALQNRVSVFNKWNFTKKQNREASIAARFFYESRYGGQLQFNNLLRGSDSIYGESIYTKRVEIIGKYQLPIIANIKLMYSYNFHDQNSYYGPSLFAAKQHIGFAQLVWNKRLGIRHDVLVGSAFRLTAYDDNTPATQSNDSFNVLNNPSIGLLPGIFVQDEIALSANQILLLGTRYDYYQNHGHIVSPRINYKLTPNRFQTIRLGIGNGFRVVNLFTEDHQALTGARAVVIKEELKPEQSWNANINFTQFVTIGKGFINIDASAFYTYFSNRIIADYDTDPNQIVYANLDGYAVSRGVSLNGDMQFVFPLRANIGFTLMDVYKKEKNKLGITEKSQQIHAPKFSGTFQLTYTIQSINISIDYTGQVYGPMRLPVLPNDFRPDYSPWFTLQNMQLTKKLNNGIQVYGGVKNLFNFIPQNPIMRPFDPFDKTVGNTQTNPNGYTFDPSYNYASLQGIRGFFGARFVW